LAFAEKQLKLLALIGEALLKNYISNQRYKQIKEVSE
jgi:hypothetical protein